MAEVIAAASAIASVAQLADYGFKLSVKLFTYGEAVYGADKSVRTLSNDVSLTSTVLKELTEVLGFDDSKHVSNRAVETAQKITQECLAVFKELDEALEKSLGNMGIDSDIKSKKKVNRGVVAFEKLRWPFKQQKMELLRSNLDRLKASLTLMLQVISYARDISARRENETTLMHQREIIERFARSERVLQRKYLALQNSDEHEDDLLTYGYLPQYTEKVAELGFESKGERGFNAGSERELPVIYTAREMTAQSWEPRIVSPPVVNPKALIGELLLCFHLLNDVLEYHIEITQSKVVSKSGYLELQTLLKRLQLAEMKQLENEFKNSGAVIKAEAARNLQSRLREMVQVGRVAKRSREKRIDLAEKSQPADLNQESSSGPQNPEEKPVGTGRYSAVSAEIDETTKIMIENIRKVNERGERLDSLQDKTENLSVSAQGFRRGANRVRVSNTWTGMYEQITEGLSAVGSASYKQAQDLSESIYGGITSFFAPEPGADWEIITDNSEHDKQVREEIIDDNIVEQLLADWTNVPAPVEVSKKSPQDAGETNDPVVNPSQDKPLQ